MRETDWKESAGVYRSAPAMLSCWSFGMPVVRMDGGFEPWRLCRIDVGCTAAFLPGWSVRFLPRKPCGCHHIPLHWLQDLRHFSARAYPSAVFVWAPKKLASRVTIHILCNAMRLHFQVVCTSLDPIVRLVPGIPWHSGTRQNTQQRCALRCNPSLTSGGTDVQHAWVV